jgi:hypothetical protein
VRGGVLSGLLRKLQLGNALLEAPTSRRQETQE